MATETVNHPVYGPVTFLKHDAFIGYWVRKNMIWEDHMTRFFKKYTVPGSTVIDVGAFIGLHSLYIAKNCFCTVVSIEAQPYVFGILAKNIRSNSLTNTIKSIHAAASSSNGQQLIAVPYDYDEWKNPGGLGIVGSDFTSDQLVPITIPTITLDSLQLTDVSLIKIDVEGHEKEVLLGAESLIRKQKPVLIVEIMGGCDREQYKTEIQSMCDWICLNFGYTLRENVSHDYVFTNSS
jgi:FkbM family methyltransferase